MIEMLPAVDNDIYENSNADNSIDAENIDKKIMGRINNHMSRKICIDLSCSDIAKISDDSIWSVSEYDRDRAIQATYTYMLHKNES